MDAMTRAGLRVIFQELGLLRGLTLGLRVGIAQLRGAPFRGLPPADSERARRSRAQLAPAALVYQQLQRSHSPQEALQITERVIRESGRAFLRSLLGDLDLAALMARPAGERVAELEARLAPLPNATFELRFDDEGRLHFTVTRCEFARLAVELGLPELAPLFCAVDDAFFRDDLPGVHLDRATTIARGGASCPFIFEPSLAEERRD